ncbi:aldo/keto reductase [Microbacterium sp. cx-55]|uniref:aldo/keto reductase n=1 Tax=Microbacterium sp. cx-55 TaxID=2875948 RepID=UPI001CBDB712|nr:aldo/keto reductase [Microbacterium sp. cx-55]MBZ4486658.1 aldo/keto reductase [Microbacterium sp. cx-55]UGB36380.1 aldo/keto reductase [Microbacterium sp. cx-55]
MQTRTLGRQGFQSSAIAYGAMGTAIGYGPSDDTQSIAAIRHAHDLGVTHFDTAEMYGWGDGEKLLGTALAPIRDRVTIATKFGFTHDFGRDSSADHIRAVIDTSLANLGTDHIDVLYQHAPDPPVPVEDVIGVMAELVAAGKVLYLGLSNTDADDIRRAHAVHPISVMQSEYSIFSRDSESLRPTLDELGIGLVAYSPLARGFLTGAVQPRDAYDAGDFRRGVGWWAPENYDANVSMVTRLTELASEKGTTLAGLALAWLLAQSENIVPIPGSRSVGRVTENVSAADVVLTADDLARIRQIVPAGGIGDRGM